ncbi:MAG: hypothetical protein WDN30_14405 [Pararobbsia sp.]
MIQFSLQQITIALAAFIALALVAVLVYIIRRLPSTTIAADTKAVEGDIVKAVDTAITDAKTELSALAKIADKLRMSIWLVLGIACYVASIYVGPSNPVVQTTLYKIGHVTTLAWIGYWIARKGVGRVDATATQGDKLARALVIGAVIIAGSLGL